MFPWSAPAGHAGLIRESVDGSTRVVTVCGKNSGRVPLAGLVCLKSGSRGHLFYRARIYRGRTGERRSMSEEDYVGLIAAAHKELHAPVILIWDNLNTHRSSLPALPMAMSREFRGEARAAPAWLRGRCS
jgi:hypothetical protein